ncbi:hypothetical protein BGW41_005223 [Actinomortierella wolfii]|nr:hypothetical protein BGW41_005223 [Actinomortierella wolfii]
MSTFCMSDSFEEEACAFCYSHFCVCPESNGYPSFDSNSLSAYDSDNEEDCPYIYHTYPDYNDDSDAEDCLPTYEASGKYAEDDISVNQNQSEYQENGYSVSYDNCMDAEDGRFSPVDDCNTIPCQEDLRLAPVAQGPCDDNKKAYLSNHSHFCQLFHEKCIVSGDKAHEPIILIPMEDGDVDVRKFIAQMNMILDEEDDEDIFNALTMTATDDEDDDMDECWPRRL